MTSEQRQSGGKRLFSGKPRAAIAGIFVSAGNIARLCRMVRRSGTGRALWLLRYVEDLLGGHESSACGLPVDADRRPLPWYTYPAIEFLERFDFSACDVFEYGSGNGSKFWARRARTVTSVESDPRWHESGARELAPNQTLLLREGKTEYVNALHLAGGDFDVVVIDGAYRYNCALEAVGRLKGGGVIVLDNADWYPDTSKVLRDSGFTQFDFAGTGPLNAYAWCTSLFCRDRPSFPRRDERAAGGVRGGLAQHAEDDRLV